MKNIWNLFFSFFRVALVTHGGGYAMVGVIEDDLVNKQKLLSEDEFFETISVCQSFPGPLAITSSLFVGYKVGKLPGAIASFIGALLPPFVFIFILSTCFMSFEHNIYVKYILKGIDATVPMLMLLAVVNFGKKMKKTPHNIIVALIALIALSVFKINPAFIVIISAIYGIIVFGFLKKEDK
ncbi:MAG: chromate transporter [Sarcina sp.]